MRRIILGAVVGGIIIFIWQFLSFALLDLHRPAQQYTSNQDEILSYLSSKFTTDGQYFLPTTPKGASSEEMEANMKNADGKPWAVISYHTAWKSDMTMNMIRGLLVDMVMAALFCWILSRMTNPRFVTIFMSAISVGLIVFLNVPYTNHIWYDSFDLMAHLMDAIVSWGLVGLWLGYLYNDNGRVRKPQYK